MSAQFLLKTVSDQFYQLSWEGHTSTQDWIVRTATKCKSSPIWVDRAIKGLQTMLQTRSDEQLLSEWNSFRPDIEFYDGKGLREFLSAFLTALQAVQKG
jgi:hypothetical protein